MFVKSNEIFPLIKCIKKYMSINIKCIYFIKWDYSNKILIKISMFIIQITTLTMTDNKKTY